MPNDDAPDPNAAAGAIAARPPPTEPDPKVLLDHIAEVSRNASATWFGLLGLLAFVGITLLGHRDADFFARGAGTQLPLVNITVPVRLSGTNPWARPFVPASTSSVAPAATATVAAGPFLSASSSSR